MQKTLFCLFVLVVFSFGTVVNPSQSTIAILLDASGLCDVNSSVSWENLQVNKFLKEQSFYKDSNSVYCYSYDASIAPFEAIDSLFKGANSVFNKAIQKWSKNKTSKDSLTPPSKFIIIAEGSAGLAVREYIQSKEYQGEIDNVIFFNTPHEGTGFADHSLLNGSSVLDKTKNVYDYSEIIPLALAIYLVGESETLENLMMSLLKESVFGMAQNAGNIKENFSDYFISTDNSYKSLLYLAQDLDLNDSAYDYVKITAKEKGLDLGDYVGSTQLLNSYSKLSSYSHPAYSNVYSYGFPTIGNGRRTLADFIDQSKNHVSKDKLQKLLTESVSKTLENNGLIASDSLNELISKAMTSDFNAMELANQIALKYEIPIGQISECIRDISTLSKLKINKENLSRSVLNVISIANKYLPEKYKSELYSTFIDEYSAALSELGETIKSIENEFTKGSELISNALSNYAINFFEEGTFDVPAFSAIGNNVQAFKESSVKRIGYSLKDYIQENEFKNEKLKSYIKNVSKVGELETIRQTIDKSLKIACNVAGIVGSKEACRAAQFMANVSLIAKVSLDIETTLKDVIALKEVKYAALKQSIEQKADYSSWQDHKGISHKITSSDMEKMLFGLPVVSLQTVRKSNANADSIIPLILYNPLNNDDSDSIMYAYICSSLEFNEINKEELDNSNSVMLKDIYSEEKNGRFYKYSKYGTLGSFIVKDFIQEYRFIIDDFQPDSLRLIKFDFNARIQIAYKRDGNSWYVYRGTNNQWEENPIDTLFESPVQKDGLFVFRPKEVLNNGVSDKNDSLLLSAIQEDGANSVSIYIVNKIGIANNQRIMFKFQAVDYLIEEGWPKSFDVVSNMDTVDIYSNDLGYGGILVSSHLIVSSLHNLDTVAVFTERLEDAGNRYRFWADLSSIFENKPFENTAYTLKWFLTFKEKILSEDSSIQERLITYTPQVIVYGDNSAPRLVFDSTITQGVFSLNNDVVLSSVLNLDSAHNQVLRGLRSFIVRKTTKDTLWLLHRAYVGSPLYEIRKNNISNLWSDSVELYVQAYDFANPNNLMKNQLMSVVKDSAKTSWPIVMQNALMFKSGINGISIHKSILIDSDSPQIKADSVTFHSFTDKTLPLFSKQKNEAEILLNSMDTLIVSFDIEENLFGRDSENVVVELVFNDSLENGRIKSKRYLTDFVVTKFSKRFVFKEPDINRLENGIYNLTIFLTDVAGNKSFKQIVKKLRVDRTAPQIQSISLGDVAYENVAELKKGTAHIIQSADDVRNRSDLACYVKVNVRDKEGVWIGPILETVSKNAQYSNYEFDFKDATVDTSNGFWYVYFGCYDNAGNFEKNMNFMGMGVRYPEITYPKKGSDPYFNQILIRGVAPNPEVRGNSNQGMFSIFWKKQGDSTWSENGIEYLVFDRSLALTNRDLAVWHTQGLNLDERSYVLKLSVKSCDSCEWVSTERIILLDDFIPLDTANAPQIVITPPINKQKAGQIENVSIELRNVSDTSKWFVRASIEAPSLKDSTDYVKVVEKTFDPVIISPFKTPALQSDTGLSIWQEKNDSIWHVRYVGDAKGLEIKAPSSEKDSIVLRMTPYLSIRFVDNTIDWKATPKADSLESLGFVMDSISVKNEYVDMLVPAYNMTKMWKVGKDSLHLTFKTTTPFTVDASLIDGAVYKTSLSPIVHIFPEKYKARIAWNGLVNGASSRGSLVKMNVVAYEKGNEKNIITQKAEWYLEYEPTEIEFSSNNLEEYYINFLGSERDSSEIKLGDYGFQFKLTGRSAYVTAEILDSTNNVVQKLLENELVFASFGNQWQTLRWNGIKNDGFIQLGKYNIHFLVKNDTGIVIDTLYPFEMRLGDDFVKAQTDSAGYMASLKMLEATLDSNGEYRYVGKPDYLLRTDVSATILPENERIFDYGWDVYGMQKPTLYKKTRPSLGIRRHRNEFWATVVTLVMSESRAYQISYEGLKRVCHQTGPGESRGYWYRMDVKQIPFRENEMNVELFVDLDSARETTSRVYGYLDNSNDSQPVTLHNLVAIKILPASAYNAVKEKLGNETTYFGNAIWETDHSSADEFSWDSVYKKESYVKDSLIGGWFTNWNGQALYYEAVNTNFNILATSDTLMNVFDSNSFTKTFCDIENIMSTELAENDEKFVCGPSQAIMEIDTATISRFNPHAYMMNVKLESFEPNESFVVKNFNKDYCSEMDGSGTDIKVKFVLEIDSNYWNPPADRWGTNNLANRYVRFDPLNKTLYGDKGYITKIKDYGMPNFYNGSSWIYDATFNNGPTVFEVQRLPMVVVPENPLLFNDELSTNDLDAVKQDSSIKFYPSEYSWRFYRGNGEIPYKAEARSLLNNGLWSEFYSNDWAAINGEDKMIKRDLLLPYDIYFDIAPVITFEEAKGFGIIASKNSVKYPLSTETNCSLDTSGGYRFYGCDKWVSRVHLEQNDWNSSQWDTTFTLNGYIRNPLTDVSATSLALTSVLTPQNKFDSNDGYQSYSVAVTDWNEKEKNWNFELNKTDLGADDALAEISIDRYELKPYNSTSSWKIDSANSSVTNGKYTIFNKGKTHSSLLDFYRSRDTVFTSERGLNNRLFDDVIPLASVIAQSLEPADTILVSKWAKKSSVKILDVFKRNMHGDSILKSHPYLQADYDSTSKQFFIERKSLDIYASREDEIVTLQGYVPYDISNWSISYIQNGMRFKVADGTQKPIEATMNLNQLQGNTSFFLTYSVLGDITNYTQLDVHIGEHIKAREINDIYSMYGNVHIHFDANAWESDEDVTVRTMDPSECYDCQLFRNMAPIGPVLEFLPSYVFPKGKEPLVTIDISVKTLIANNLDYNTLKIYKLDSQKPEILPLEIGNVSVLLDSNLNNCTASDWHSCAFVRINAKTPTFSKFVILDSLKADCITIVDSIPESIEPFSCPQMDFLWLDTLWMGTANGWFEFPYFCTQNSNYLLQLNVRGNVSAEHRGASNRPIIWSIKNTDLYVVDSIYQSSIVLYGIDGNIEQKLGPIIKLDSVAPFIEFVETSISENENGERVIHVEAEINESGSKIAQTSIELFLGGKLLQSVNIPENNLPIYEFKLTKKELFNCVGCKATIKVIVEDKGHNFDKVVKQTEKLYPYPSSLVLWYPFAEGGGNIGYEIMTKDDSKRMHMDFSSISTPWNGRYGVHLYKSTDSASSRFKLATLDSVRPFTFEFNYSAGNTQNDDWAILSFVGENEWTFGIGTYNRYFLKVGTELFYFNSKRDANISTHIAVVINGKNATLYKNGKYVETIGLSKNLFYGGNGKLSIGARNNLRSAVGSISNLRFYSSALTNEDIQNSFNGIISEENITTQSVRAVALTERDDLMIDQSCSAPGKAYLHQKSAENNGIMTWNVDVIADNYSLYIFHRNYTSEESRIEVFVNGVSLGIFKLTSTGLWKSEKLAEKNLNLVSGINEISVRPFGNLGIVALAIANSKANIEADQINYNESAWINPKPKANVFMKYENLSEKQWAQVRFDLQNVTDKSLENAMIRYYYKGEGENVNAVSFYPSSPMRVVNDGGTIYYAELALTESIAAYSSAYFGQGPLIGLHRLTSPNNYFPMWDITDDPSYFKGAETEYVKATGIALLDSEGNLLNEFACYDEDGPIQKPKIKVRAMAKDNSFSSSSESNVAIYVENSGSVPVDSFEVRYYYRDTAEIELDIYWNAFSATKKVNAGGDLNYISFMYDVILNSGEKSDYGNGVQFALYHPNRTNDFNAIDDPSHYNLNNYEMQEADSIVVLDKRGNLIWGNAPQPKFNANYITKETYDDLIHRDGNVIYVEINQNGHYILETVNAAGLPLITLYNGTWSVGEHSISLSNYTIAAGSYLVLRMGSEIISWKLIN